MKVEIKSIETTTISKSVKLPYYTKSNCHFFKVYSEAHCICATDLDGNYGIVVIDSSIALKSDHKESNETEFKVGFEKVLKIISSKL
jgi:hypothetical protein